MVVAERDHVLFRYTPKHSGSVPADMLAGFRGYVLANASSVYHELYRNEPDIIEVSCWAHARRRWYEALAVDRDRALVGIGFIGLFYDAHRAATDPATSVTDTHKRRAAAEPPSAAVPVDRTRAAAAGRRIAHPKAMNYLVNQRESLSRGRSTASRQQSLGARIAPASGRKGELVLRRERRRR